MDEINAKYNKTQAPGIIKLRKVINKLNPSQTNLLQSLTDFRVDVVESNHQKAQLTSSQQFTASRVEHLKNSIEKVLKNERDILEKKKQGKNSTMEMLKQSGFPEETIKLAVQPVQALIEEVEKSIREWEAIFASVNELLQPHGQITATTSM